MGDTKGDVSGAAGARSAGACCIASCVAEQCSPTATQAATFDRIKAGILIAMMITITGLIVGFGAALYLEAKDSMTAEADGALAHVPEALEAALAAEAKAMSAALDVIAGDAALAAALDALDRQTAQSRALPLLASLRNEHSITHFSFHDAEGVNFLRVHAPDRSGGPVAHFIFVRAARTGKPAHGIALDRHGQLVLRVVRPWYDQGKLIGYVEMGHGIEHVTEELHRSLGVKLILTIHKTFLDRTVFEEARRGFRRVPRWDLIPDQVVIDPRDSSTPPQIVDWLTADHDRARSYHDSPAPGRDLSVGARRYRATLFGFRDAGGRLIGDLVVMKDFTSRYAALREASISVALICLMLGVGLFLFFRCFLARLSAKLDLRTTELRETNETLTREIVERKNTEQRLELFKHLIDQANDAVLVIDAGNARLIETNDSACADLGYTRAELLSLSMPDIAMKIPNMASWTMHVQCFRRTGPMTSEDLYRRKDGSVLPVEISLKYVQRGEQGYVVAGVRDITARKEAEEALRYAKDAAEQASRLKSQFLSTVSHEIRTPLNGIIGFAEGIASAETVDAARDLSRTILAESDILLELINTLLDHAKIEAGRLEIESQPFAPRRALEGIVSSCHARARDKDLALEVSVAADVPEWVMGDAFRLRQVLLNLAGNAIKFTEAGSVTVVVETVEGDEADIVLRFSVTDTGIGIAPDRQAAIFDSFTQADDSTTRKYGGTGLGTTISRELVTLMGGRIELESELDKGSTFWFTLPTTVCTTEAVAEIERAEAARSAEDVVGADCPPMSILVAEDYPTNQQVIRMHLEAAGHAVTIAANGREAVDLCRSRRFDLVFMDLQMPEMDGLEATRRIRRENREYVDVPIIGLTANAEPQARRACIKAGMKDVVTKPVRSSTLRRTIADWRAPGGKTDTAEPADEPAHRPADQATPDGRDAAAPMDYEKAVREFCGDAALVKTVTEQFLQTLAEQTALLWQAVAEGETETVAREAHKIKGGAANLMAEPLSQAAAQLEAEAKLGRADDAGIFLAHLVLEIQRLEAFCRSHVLVA